MKLLRTSLLITALSFLALPAWLAAQSIEELKRNFVGKSAFAEMRIPATKSGIDIDMGRGQSLDLTQFGKQITKHGVGVNRSDVIEITDIVLSKKKLEVILGGGPREHPSDPPGAKVNLVYKSDVPTSLLMPDGFQNALANVIRILGMQSLLYSNNADMSNNPWGLREGLTATEIRSKLGTPSTCAEREQSEGIVANCVFTTESAQQINVKFVNGILTEFETTIERNVIQLNR